MAELGHASSGPVLSAITTFQDGGETRRGLTFAGQFAGHLDAGQLEACASAFCVTATSATRFFALCIRPLLSSSDEWTRRFEMLEDQLNKVVAVPRHLQGHIHDYRNQLGPRPRRDDANY